MSTYPGQPAAPKKTLMYVAVACFVIGIVLAGFFVWRIVQTAPRSPQPVENGAVHLTKDGLTIYASVPVLAPPCEAKNADGGDVPLKKPSGSETISINGDTWYVVARSEQTVPAGDYTISCTDDETSATYAAGPHMSVVAFVLSILGTVFSFLIFGGLGVVLLIVGVVRNRRRNRPNNTFPNQQPPGAPGNYPPGNYPPGNYPPGSYPQAGYPAPGSTQPPTGTFPVPPPYNPGPNPDRPQDR